MNETLLPDSSSLPVTETHHLCALSDDSQTHFGSYCLAVFWLVGTVFAFWLFMASDYRNFASISPQQLAVFEKTNFSNTLEAYAKRHGQGDSVDIKGYVFHFWNPDCQCDRFNRPHVEKLISLYAPLGIRFFIVPKAGETRSAKRWASSLGQSHESVMVLDSSLARDHWVKEWVQTGPAAAVLDHQGKLAYFGPYSLGGICKADENSLIENALSKVVIQSKPLQTYASGFGCFCNWQ